MTSDEIEIIKVISIEDKPVTKREITGIISERDSNIDLNNINIYLQTLIKKNLLLKNKDTYQVYDKMFQVYIKMFKIKKII